jgi:hypothetical protein
MESSIMPGIAVIAIAGIVASFGLPLLLVGLVLYYRHRKDRLVHETIARLAEKGLPVPPELLQPRSRAQAGLRAGLVLIAMGLALAIFFWGWGPGPAIGLIPGLMGLALLIAWKIENRSQA